MNPRRSLFLKILLWFFMSLLLLVVILAGIFNLDFHLRPDSALITGLGGQGKAVGGLSFGSSMIPTPMSGGRSLSGSERPMIWISSSVIRMDEFWWAPTA